jgi:hypothetical protein
MLTCPGLKVVTVLEGEKNGLYVPAKRPKSSELADRLRKESSDDEPVSAPKSVIAP